MKKVLIFSGLFLTFLGLSAQKTPKQFKLPEVLEEASGLYVQASDSLWWINDSGNATELYLTNQKGKLQATLPIPVKNIDWEDLTADDKGNIYIGEFGNNRNARKNLKIYVFQPQTQALDSIEFAYPDQTLFPPAAEQSNFDMEGFFWYQDSLYLFSKNRIGKGNYFTKQYVIPAQTGQQKVILRDSILLPERVVTAAAISPDKQRVALLSYHYKIRGKKIKVPASKVSIFLLDGFAGNDFLSGSVTEQKIRLFAPVSQYECLDFLDNNTVLIGSEKTVLYKQKAKRIRLKQRPILD